MNLATVSTLKYSLGPNLEYFRPISGRRAQRQKPIEITQKTY